jgi:hypothetical protein
MLRTEAEAQNLPWRPVWGCNCLPCLMCHLKCCQDAVTSPVGERLDITQAFCFLLRLAASALISGSAVIAHCLHF